MFSVSRDHSLTSERGVDEVLPVGTEQSVAKHQVQTAEQQVVRVHQVITDHTEVSFTNTQLISHIILCNAPSVWSFFKAAVRLYFEHFSLMSAHTLKS